MSWIPVDLWAPGLGVPLSPFQCGVSEAMAGARVTSLALSLHRPASLPAMDTMQSPKGGYENADTNPSQLFCSCGGLGDASRLWELRRTRSCHISVGPGM